MAWDEVIKITNCKIRVFTSVSSDVGRTIQILKDGVVVASGVYTSSLLLDFELAGKAKYVVKDVTTGFSQNVQMGAGSYAEVETGLTTSTWEGINRVIKAGRAAEFLEVGDVFPITMQSGVTRNFVVAGINTYGLNEVDFICKDTSVTAFNCGQYQVLSTVLKPVVDAILNDFPSTIQTMMSAKPLNYNDSLGNGSYKTWNPNWKLWVPSYTEMGGVAGFETNNGHKPYGLFTSDASRIFNNKTSYNYICLAYCSGSGTSVNVAGIYVPNGSLQPGLSATQTSVIYGFRIQP